MKCPHCEGRRIMSWEQNFVSEEPRGNNIFVKTTPTANGNMVLCYICANCKFIWERKEN